MKPDRVVVGTSSEKARKVISQLFAPFVRQGNPIIFMDEKSAELTKYAANSFLATKISFMNEIAQMCERLGADVDMVRKGIGSDERIGKRFLFPGIGYGGSCFPKDVKALMHSAKEAGYDFQILDAVTEVNEKQKSHLVTKVKRYFGNLAGKHFALWGLAFKPNTDDMRDAPSIDISNSLVAAGARVRGYDPVARESAAALMPDIEICGDVYEMAAGCDALVVVTEWNEFKQLDLEKLKALLNSPVIYDGRNIYDPTLMKGTGFNYRAIGRGMNGK